MIDTPTEPTDQIAADAVDFARSTMPVYLVAESPDGQVLSHSSGYPDDDTDVWLADGGTDDQPEKLADLYARYGEDLIAYAEPEVQGVAAALPEKTADGEVTINPDAKPDPKLQLSAEQQRLLADIPDRVKAAEAKGDDAEVEALGRYADAIRAGKSDADAKAEGWPDTGAVRAALIHDAGVAAVEQIEQFLTFAEDRLGITAALNGNGAVTLPTMRKAVGGNSDAQAEVVAAFEQNWAPDVNVFLHAVLGDAPGDTPDHDQEAWDALAAEARLWHAKRLAASLPARNS